MSTIGFYRYKVPSVSANGNTVTFQVGGVDAKVCNIFPLNYCDGKKILKYMNRDGQYRFMAMSNYFEESDNPKMIGKTTELVRSILTSKSTTRNVGYKSDRKLQLKSEPLSTEQLLIVRDIYLSPRVYLYIGSGTDLESDWILVDIKPVKAIRQEYKARFSTIELEVTLPETYAITML